MYEPPSAFQANFELQIYTPPSAFEANFDLSTSTPSEILSEISGIQQVASEVISELEGKGTPSEILSEIAGQLSVSGEFVSEIMGKPSHSEILSEATGAVRILGEYVSELYGSKTIEKPLGYRIVVYDSDGNAIGEVDAFRKLRISKRLNNYGESMFEMRSTDPKLSDFLSLRSNYIEVYREEGLSNNLVWSGEQALARGTLKSNNSNIVEIYSYTWFEQLFHRYTAQEVDFTTTDQGQIAWSMINTSNTLSPTGITEGTITATTNRDRTYRNQNIGEAIINLSNVVNGFDFEVTDAGLFNASSIIGSDLTNSVIFEYGYNITNATVIQDFVNPANKAIILGEAIGEDELQRVERTDATSLASYGLYEQRVSEMGTTGLSTLQDKGDAVLRKYAEPLLKVDFDLIANDISIHNFKCGDAVRVIIQDGIYNINEQYRVYEWVVEFDANGVERLSLTLGKFITL